MNEILADPAGAGDASGDPTVATTTAGWSLAWATGAYMLPFLLSRSTSPTPDHPRVLLWYRTLRQPRFKPPDLAIPIAWALIETGLAVAAYRLLRKPSTPTRNRSLALLAGNVAAIGGWSRLFFGSRNLPASTVAAAAMVGTSAAYVAESRRTDEVAAAAGIPLTAWVAFATVLTAAIWRHNR
jgi:tryptophan-rich sensory protein